MHAVCGAALAQELVTATLRVSSGLSTQNLVKVSLGAFGQTSLLRAQGLRRTENERPNSVRMGCAERIGPSHVIIATVVAQVSWALARLKMPHALVASVCSKFTQSLTSRHLSSEELSSVVWMFATIEYCPESVRHTLGGLVRDRLQTFTPIELMNLRWSFSCLGKAVQSTLLSRDRTPSLCGQGRRAVRGRLCLFVLGIEGSCVCLI